MENGECRCHGTGFVLSLIHIFREVGEALGYTVTWDIENRQAKMNNGKVMTLSLIHISSVWTKTASCGRSPRA